jgi:hypothetical protein
MQISDSTVFQATSQQALLRSGNNSLNRQQQVDKYPVKPVTIEGHVIPEDDRESSARQVQDTKPPATTIAESASDTFLLQQKLSSNQPYNKPEQLDSSPQQTSSKNNFPPGNRRSLNGLAGGALVSQNYLSNEPLALTYSTINPKRIDFFI